MTTTAAQKSRETLSKKLRIAGILIIVGLVVEGLSLLWNHPLSFVAFLGVGGILLAAGMLLYLWSLVSHDSSRES